VVTDIPLDGVGDPLGLADVDEPLVLIETVVAGDPPCPVLVDKPGKALAVISELEALVVGVTPVVPSRLNRNIRKI
jgi:hypothetical protein